MAIRILVVADEQAERELLTRVFRTHGYDVDSAGSAIEARVVLEVREPDLVVMDTNLPDENGWTFCEQVTHRDPEVPLPVLMVSRTPPPAARMLGSCAADLVTLPIDDDRLLEKVRHLLHQ